MIEPVSLSMLHLLASVEEVRSGDGERRFFRGGVSGGVKSGRCSTDGTEDAKVDVVDMGVGVGGAEEERRWRIAAILTYPI